MRSRLLVSLSAFALGGAMGCSGGSSSSSPPPPPAPSSPVINSVTPPSGADTATTAIAIQGSGFLTGVTVSVGGTACTNVVLVSGNDITCDTPTGTAGPATVVVTNPDSQTATLIGGYTYTTGTGAPTPTFTSVTPTNGPASGATVIVIAGGSFIASATVTVGGAAATAVSVDSGAQITCTTPAGTAGARDIVITNPGTPSASVTATGAFTYDPPPQVSTLTPNNGPVNGNGVVVTIAGQDYVSGATVTIGGAPTSVLTFSTTQLTVNLPSGTAGAATVIVTNPDGQSDNSATFTYNPLPTINNVTPNNGPAGGTNSVVVSGTGFLNNPSNPTVLFGSNTATVTGFGPSALTVTVPAGAGVVSVTVTNPESGSVTSTSAYTYNPPPSVTTVAPANGPAAGGTTVVVSGGNFVNGAGLDVQFAGASASSIVWQSISSIQCVTPTGTPGASVTVTVINPDLQSGSATGAFLYNAAAGSPTVTNVSPGSGTVAGGTPVTITGTNFDVGATVTFGAGSQATSVVVVSDTSITALTPSAVVTGGVTVTVTNPATGNASWGTQWTYTAAGTTVTVTGVSPSAGQAAGGATGGTTVTITGTNFGTSPSVHIQGIAASVTATAGGTSVTITSPAASFFQAGGVQSVRVTDTSNGETGVNTVPGYTFTPDPIHNAALPDMSNADVAVDGAGNIHVVFQTNPTTGNNDILYFRSSDGGETWNNGPFSSGRVTSTTNNSTVPRIAASGNTVFIVWQEAAASTTIDYVYSTNNGAAYTSIASLPNNGAVVGSPDVAIDTNGTVYAAWLELGNVGAWGTDVDVWAATGSVTGIASATDVRISNTGAFNGNPSVSADGTGNAIVVWTWTANAPAVSLPADVQYNRTTNGGTTWAGNANIQTGGGQVANAHVALKGTDAVVVFLQTAGVPATFTINSYYSINTGSSWLGAVSVASSATPKSRPGIAVDAAGFFTVLWNEIGASQTNIMMSRSSDVGITWSVVVAPLQSGTASTMPAIAAGAAGVWSAVWAEFDTTATPNNNSIVHW